MRKAIRMRPLDVKDEVRLNNEQAFARQNSEGYFISCWNMFDGETLKMWAEYGNCVCIFSRIELMKPELDRQLDQIVWGAVRYSEKDRISYNLIDFAFTKTHHFEHERELRILLQCYDPLHRTGRNLTLENFPEHKLHFWPDWVPDCKRRRIQLKSVVTQIRLSPWLDATTADEIRHWVHVKNFECPIMDSSLKSAFTPSSEFKKSCP